LGGKTYVVQFIRRGEKMIIFDHHDQRAQRHEQAVPCRTVLDAPVRTDLFSLLFRGM
jgi:hypothetical protein